MRSEAMLSSIKAGIKNVKAVSYLRLRHYRRYLMRRVRVLQWDINNLISQVSFLPVIHLVKLIKRSIQLSRKTSRADSAIAEQRLGQVLALRSILKTIPAIVTALGGAKSNLLAVARQVGLRSWSFSPCLSKTIDPQVLSDPRSLDIERLIDGMSQKYGKYETVLSFCQ